MRRLLLLSNSRDAAGQFLKWPQPQIRDFLGNGVRKVAFVPYASVASAHEVTERVSVPFAEMGYRIASVHGAVDVREAVRRADAIAVSGGNTFLLLARLYETELLDAIRERVLDGVPYVGWSAGSVVACPTIQTTNDMPIVVPPRMRALGLVPFQINAHYTDFHPPGFQGETRAERLREYIAVNRGVRVIGLPEGTMLRVEGDDVRRLGDGAAPVFASGEEVRYYTPGEDLSGLMGG